MSDSKERSLTRGAWLALAGAAGLGLQAGAFAGVFGENEAERLFRMTGERIAAAADAEGPVFSSEHYDYRVVTVVDGLEHPWGIAFLPDGGLLVTERTGALRLVRDGELVEEPVSGVPEVLFGGQGGLLDVALHPEFESNRWVYLSYSKPGEDAGQNTTAVVRGRLEDGALAEVQEIFEAQAWAQSRGHFGSRLVFDNDGYLFITIGDRQVPPSGELAEHTAQDLTTHAGTVVRLHDDGSVPEDNPFVGRDDALPEIWSYGHRNQQGMALHPETGELWLVEHGPQGGDEINRVEPGLNYGWPIIGYGVQYGPARDQIHEGTEREGLEQPVYYWDPSIAPSGFAIYDGERFPEWRGDLLTGALGGLTDCCRRLSRVSLENGEAAGEEERLLEDQYRIRDVRVGPDGYVYLALNDRAGNPTPIVRLEPVE